MKIISFYTIVFFLFSIYPSLSQTVGKRPPKITLLDYNTKLDDGNLQFEVDVRMADCISYLEFKSADSKKTFKVKVHENDYYLNEENGHEIILRLSIGTLKELLKKKLSLDLNLVIYSKTGKAIYNGEVLFNKADLIATAGTSPNPE